MSSSVFRWDHRIDNVMHAQANCVVQHRLNRSARQQDATSRLEDSVRNAFEAYLRKAGRDVLRRELFVCDSFGSETRSHLAGVRILCAPKPQHTCVDKQGLTSSAKELPP